MNTYYSGFILSVWKYWDLCDEKGSSYLTGILVYNFSSLTSWDENGWWLGRKVTSPEKRVIPQHTRLTCLAVAILNKYGLQNKSRDFILSKLLS